MRIQIRSDAVEIDGYVNVVERDSVALPGHAGKKMIEKIRQGAFGKSLLRRSAVKVLLNHDPARILANTSDGTAKLREDPVGLYCRATISDTEVIEKAKAGKLSGWSFGFVPLSDASNDGEDGYEHRDVFELDLREVSILDDTKTPAYPACCIATRDDEGETVELRFAADLIEVTECPGGASDKSSEDDTPDGAGDPADGNYSYRNALVRAQIH